MQEELAVTQPLDLLGYLRLSELICRMIIYFCGWRQRTFDQAVERRAQQLARQETIKAHWRGFAIGFVVALIIVLAFSSHELG